MGSSGWRAALLFILGMGVSVAAGSAAAAADDRAARVILLANSDDPDSVRIARHYAEARGVPPENLIQQKMPVSETITWNEFVTWVWQPLLRQLVERQWVDAIPMALKDDIGRGKFAVHGHRISALVVCRGVPLKIAHDPLLAKAAPPFTKREEFQTNAGAVDAELSLLATPNYAINAFIPNPLYHNDHPSASVRSQVVLVSRLDGPSVDDALQLVDRALTAERQGLVGRAYVDLSDRNKVGNVWLETTARLLSQLHFNPTVDRAPATLAPGARLDAPAWYFGWYTPDLDGPFTLPGFRFPPGAIALHIHSYSAASLRSSTAGWTGPLVARGVTATVGNVFEPYLEFTHRPDLLLQALTRGATWAEAAYYALRGLSWQAVLIGDPLYRPFAVPLAAQLSQIERISPRLSHHVVLRRMEELDTAKRGDEAIALAVAQQRRVPSLALGLELARRWQAQGQLEAARQALGFVARVKHFPTDEWALARDTAVMLASLDQSQPALAVWQTLLETKEIPGALRAAWLAEAYDLAVAAKDSTRIMKWKNAREETQPIQKP